MPTETLIETMTKTMKVPPGYSAVVILITDSSEQEEDRTQVRVFSTDHFQISEAIAALADLQASDHEDTLAEIEKLQDQS